MCQRLCNVAAQTSLFTSHTRTCPTVRHPKVTHLSGAAPDPLAKRLAACCADSAARPAAFKASANSASEHFAGDPWCETQRQRC